MYRLFINIYNLTIKCCFDFDSPTERMATYNQSIPQKEVHILELSEITMQTLNNIGKNLFQIYYYTFVCHHN